MYYYFFCYSRERNYTLSNTKEKVSYVSGWMLLNNGVAIKYLATDAVFSCTSDALVIITAEMDDLQPMSSDNIYDDSGSFHF